MQTFTNQRTAETRDEIWVLQHPPVYSQGLSCQSEPFTATDIPVVATDRGGQITYHGPGQAVFYVLIDLKRRGLGVKSLVRLLEQSVMDYLRVEHVDSERMKGAPGVYVRQKKVAALGLRIRRGSSYHGMSVNVDMDLSPFLNIHPCGYEALEVTQLKDVGVNNPIEQVQDQVLRILLSHLTNNNV